MYPINKTPGDIVRLNSAPPTEQHSFLLTFDDDYRRSRLAKCIIPAGQWDGDTGIPELLEQYRLANFIARSLNGPLPAEMNAIRERIKKRRNLEREKQLELEQNRHEKAAEQAERRAKAIAEKKAKREQGSTCHLCGKAIPFDSPYIRVNMKRFKVCRECKEVHIKRVHAERLEKFKLYRKTWKAAQPKPEQKPKNAGPTIPDGHARCPCCQRVMPLDSSPIDRYASNGHRSRCHECTKAYRRERAEKSIAANVEVTERRCNRCHQVKPLAEFHRSVSNKLGRSYTCKQCAIEFTNEYRKKIKANEKQRDQGQGMRRHGAGHSDFDTSGNN